MQSKSTFSILFWTYDARSKNNKTNIYARITVNEQKANISLKQKVNLPIWDSKRQKSKGNSIESRTVNLSTKYWPSYIKKDQPRLHL